MDKKWNFIADQMTNIQSALLRFRDKEGRSSFQIKNLKSPDPYSVNFILPESTGSKKMINHSASLTQKTENGYLYVTGIISRTKKDDILSMNVQKAYWFTRKRKGNNSWLEEVCVYDHLQQAS